jgi:glycosyltransferase involved in cell wall biosynthesis
MWFSVTSVIDYVDKVLLWDTGSTDGSVEIAEKLLEKYPNKIILKNINQKDIYDFPLVRQKMLDETRADWIMMLDGDEIWWKDSIEIAVKTINTHGGQLETIVVPTINLVGDIFHYQPAHAGRYRFGSVKGHYNLRFINTTIPGLKSSGVHGVWGWTDGNGVMVQNREAEKMLILDAPYLHATFLQRATNLAHDQKVPKRKKKYKYEMGLEFARDFYYPESLFTEKPNLIASPWKLRSMKYKVWAGLITPLRNIKRRIWEGNAGY